MRKAFVAPALAALLTLSLVALAGCAEEDVGVPCKGEKIDPQNSTGDVQITTNALDCRSRLCLTIGNQTDENVRPLCTQVCESDDDCPESADTCPNSERFVCRVARQTGGLAYCKMCICNAFLPEDFKDPTIPAGVTPNCPSL